MSQPYIPRAATHASGAAVTFPGPAGFISPHLDDVVLSCASAIAPGSTVLTVFSSGPQSVDPLPEWDVRCGFRPGDDVSKIRREEDDLALEMFGARAIRLDYWAHQYRATAPAPLGRLRRVADRISPRLQDKERLLDELRPELARVIDQLDLRTWFVPLGVGHPDHKLTTAAVLLVARSRPEIDWVAYEDLPYARQGKHLILRAKRLVAKQRFALSECQVAPQARGVDKRTAVGCYSSQLRALGSLAETAIIGPERYYRLIGADVSRSPSVR